MNDVAFGGGDDFRRGLLRPSATLRARVRALTSSWNSRSVAAVTSGVFNVSSSKLVLCSHTQHTVVGNELVIAETSPVEFGQSNVARQWKVRKVFCLFAKVLCATIKC
jgi:hypothetical protein